MATMREQAIEIARRHAKAHEGDHDYLKGTVGGDWMPHTWVVDAVEEVLAKVDRSGPTRAECVTRFNEWTVVPSQEKLDAAHKRIAELNAELDGFKRARAEVAAAFGAVSAAQPVEVVVSSGWAVLAGAALEDIPKGAQVQLQPSTGNVSAFYPEGVERPLMGERIAVRDAPAVRALLEWVLQVELVEREGGNVNDLCKARSALIFELIKRGNVLMPHDSDIIAANLARVMIHDIEGGQKRGQLKGAGALSGMARPPESAKLRSFEQRLEELAEEAYWYFDAHRAGRSRGPHLTGSPMEERDAFKGQIRRVARTLVGPIGPIGDDIRYPHDDSEPREPAAPRRDPLDGFTIAMEDIQKGAFVLRLNGRSYAADAIRCAMELAANNHGDGAAGTFNAANFSGAFKSIAGTSGPIDGKLVRAMLRGRRDVVELAGGAHFRIVRGES